MVSQQNKQFIILDVYCIGIVIVLNNGPFWQIIYIDRSIVISNNELLTFSNHL